MCLNPQSRHLLWYCLLNPQPLALDAGAPWWIWYVIEGDMGCYTPSPPTTACVSVCLCEWLRIYVLKAVLMNGPKAWCLPRKLQQLRGRLRRLISWQVLLAFLQLVARFHMYCDPVGLNHMSENSSQRQGNAQKIWKHIQQNSEAFPAHSLSVFTPGCALSPEASAQCLIWCFISHCCVTRMYKRVFFNLSHIIFCLNLHRSYSTMEFQ